MEWRPFSPVFMLTQIVLVVVLLVANYFYVTWFIRTAEPAAKATAESVFEVRIERNIMGSWTVPAKHLTAYKGSKLILQAKVFAFNLLVMAGFVLVFFIELLVLILLARWLYSNDA